MGIYLSVDLDYWKTGRHPEYFLKRLIALHKPMLIKQDHHELLRHMNSFSYDCLMNIDWHSDLCENVPNIPSLECGTWGNHIRERNRKHFLWVYPASSCVEGPDNSSSSGYCNMYAKLNPFLVRKPHSICGWEKVSKRKKFITEEELSQVIAIGICLSPDFTSCYVLERTERHLKELGLKVA